MTTNNYYILVWDPSYYYSNQGLVDLVVLLCRRILVSATDSADEHDPFLFEGRRTETTFKIVLIHRCDHFVMCVNLQASGLVTCWVNVLVMETSMCVSLT